MDAEKELQKRYEQFGKGSILDEPPAQRFSKTFRTSGQATVWASLTPEDIDLIADLTVKRLIGILGKYVEEQKNE